MILADFEAFTREPRETAVLAKIRYSHDAMIELIIAEPHISQNALAARFGYSPAWISNIIASDAFQARLAERRDEVINPELRATIEERFRALVRQSLNVLQEKLTQPQVDPELALKAAELGTRALGYGARDRQSATQVNFVVQLPAKADSPEAWEGQFKRD